MVRIDVAPPAPCRHTRKGATLGLGTIEMSAKYLRIASRPTDSWSPRGRGFPPHDLVTPLGSKNLPFPKVIDPEAPPPRTERHVPNSIAAMRRRLIIALVSTLSRCPCCATPVAKGSRRKKFMTQ